MNKALALLTFSLAVAPSFAALKQGEHAPDFKTQASLAGKEFTFSLGDTLKKGPVVVYFYPAAFTGGCNLQAHTFAENHDKFAAAGASVVGVSLDGIARLNQFSADPQVLRGQAAGGLRRIGQDREVIRGRHHGYLQGRSDRNDEK